MAARLKPLRKPQGRAWLVMVAHGWARSDGDEPLSQVAARACQNGYNAGTPARGEMVVFHVHPDATVDEMGYIRSPAGRHPPHGKAVVVADFS